MWTRALLSRQADIKIAERYAHDGRSILSVLLVKGMCIYDVPADVIAGEIYIGVVRLIL